MGRSKTSIRGRTESSSQANKPSSAIRGKISGPIPMDDDEFPMRAPGTSVATSIDATGKSTADESIEGATVTTRDETSTIGTAKHTSLTAPSHHSDRKPKRKGTLRTVLGRLFGKKRASVGPISTDHAEQLHEPVSRLLERWTRTALTD